MLGWLLLIALFGWIPALVAWVVYDEAVSAPIPKALLAAVCTIAAMIGGVFVLFDGDGLETSVARYCQYGAVSAAQLDGCKRHVTVDQIERSDTNAAQYARYVLSDCLEDSGPYCEDAGPEPPDASQIDNAPAGMGFP